MIKRVVNRIKSVKRQNVFWHDAANKLKSTEIIEGRILNTYIAEKKVLVVCPHPDDELFGCHEILSQGGIDIYYAGYTGEDCSEINRKNRLAELELYSKSLGNSLFFDKPDETTCLKELLKNNYDLVFIPPYIDWHWEHRKTFINLLNKLTEIEFKGLLGLYMVTVPIPAKYVNYYNPISKSKWKSFKLIYKSQSNMPINRFKAVSESYNAINEKGLEPYVIKKFEEIKHIYNQISLYDEDELDQLKTEINDLISIRIEARRLYERLFSIEE